MFELVNDIAHYPRFLPGCKSARVISASEEEMVGELCLAKHGISHCFTTRNNLDKPRSIVIHLVKGDFSRFQAVWHFDALAEQACKVSFNLEFEFGRGVVNLAAQRLFAKVADDLVDAMVRRAGQIYGP